MSIFTSLLESPLEEFSPSELHPANTPAIPYEAARKPARHLFFILSPTLFCICENVCTKD